MEGIGVHYTLKKITGREVYFMEGEADLPALFEKQ